MSSCPLLDFRYQMAMASQCCGREAGFGLIIAIKPVDLTKLFSEGHWDSVLLVKLHRHPYII